MKKLICFLAIFLSSVSLCFGMDWKALHEKADKISFEDAFKAVLKTPGSIDDTYVLGLVYLNLHKDKQAGVTFEKILKIDPNCFEAKWGLAEVLRRQHDAPASRKLLEEVIKADIDFSPAYITMAYLEYMDMHFKQAINFSETVLEQGRDNVDLSNYVRAIVMIAGSKGMIAHYGGPISKLINGTQVLPTLRKAEELQPDSAAVLFGIGAFYMLAPTIAGGDLDQALEYLNKAIKIDPGLADPYVRLAQAYKFKKDNDKYEFYLNKALEIDPKNELALDIKEKKCKFVCNR